MATFAITCDSPLHGTRSKESDWQSTLGTSDRRTFGYKCAACVRLDAPTPQVVAETNRAALIDKATQALANNVAFLAVANPSPIQIAAQTKALTRECSAIIRLLLGALDDTSGT